MAMSLQQILDRVSAHLLQQGRRSVRTVGTSTVCAYRTPDGDRCAAGSLMGDEPVSEGKNVQDITNLAALEACGAVSPASPLPPPSSLASDYCRMHQVRDARLGMVLRLQSIHDHGQPADWGPMLRDLAINWGLSVPSCVEAALAVGPAPSAV